MSAVKIAGEDLFYVFRPGQDGGHTLIFIHGAGGTHKHWGYQLQGLKQANRYGLDLPGHGRSGGSGRTSISGYAEVVLKFMESLELDRATIVGHSMGGAIAQYLALEHPAEVCGLVLVGSGARLRVLPNLLDRMLVDFPATVDDLLGWAFSPQADPDLITLGREEWLENDPGIVHGDFSVCDLFDVMGRLGEIRCPTLVVCGEGDSLTPPKYARYLTDSIPGAALALVPEAGHMVMLEQPQAVNRAIVEFLAERGNGGNHRADG
jgi:pimeloyl-ACP methyl ester carboxylesterase